MQYRIDDERWGQAVYDVADDVDAVVAEHLEMLRDMAEIIYNRQDDERTIAEILDDITDEFRDSIEILNETNERVIFDNGGGITVQLHGWAHYYQDPTQAAQDIAEWLKNHDTIGWEGHEIEALACDPTYDEIRNGGYWIWEPGSAYPEEGSGNAADTFFATLVMIDHDSGL